MNSGNVIPLTQESNTKVQKLTTLSNNINELSMTGDVWIDNWKNSVTEIRNKIDDLAQSMMVDEGPKTIQIGFNKITEWQSTINHPLMSIASPDEPENGSPSVLSDEEIYYSPIRNTSKNNLYISDNMSVADSQIENNVSSMISPLEGRRRIKLPENSSTPIETKQQNVNLNSPTSMADQNIIPPDTASSNNSSMLKDTTGHATIADWCDSPSQLRSMPNFRLPVESSNISIDENGIPSPMVTAASPQEDRSTYQATVDPYNGSVSLQHTSARDHSFDIPRRRIVLPKDEESSLDSISMCSMDSEEDHPHSEVPNQVGEDKHLDNEESRRSSVTESAGSDPIPEYSAAEEFSNERSWLSVPLSGGGHGLCDMKVIEPYKRAISHGGHDAHGAALIVLSACHLPDRARPDYTYVMDSLFLYVMWTLERLVVDEYVLVYLHGSASRRRVPSYHWLHKCYSLIDRRLRKSLKQLYLVHPTFWLKTVVLLTKPFISAKFFRKLTYVRSLEELMERIPLDANSIPDSVKQYETRRAGN